MFKKFFIFLFFVFFIINLPKAQSPGNPDQLSATLNIKDKLLREKKLVRYINGYFLNVPAKNLPDKKNALIAALDKYNIENKEGFEYLVESDYQAGLSNFSESEKTMIKAIDFAAKCKDDFLSYAFLSFLAFKQTEEGDVTGAISSYRMAKQVAIKLHDTNLQMIIDIDISDVFYKNSFYNQSLSYLDQAQATSAMYWPDDERIKNVIYYNKAENFFRMNKTDSLDIYNQKLKAAKANTYKLYTYKNRTDYYLYLLRHQYRDAIARIHAMQNDGGYKFENQDLQNLADAYYGNNQPDSATFIVGQLLANPVESNHPEIKYHLYELLGKIAEQKGDNNTASANFKLALQQSEEISNRLTQVDNISSLIKVDEVEGYYSQKNETYQRERLWLIIAVVLAIAIALVVALLYRAIKQKRHYEKLLFANKKEELAFINSHDVRKHLTNILGLMEVIKHSDNKGNEYLQAEGHLFEAAESLDESIKNISAKLTDA